MAGRNWTRKSIEELVDDYLRKHSVSTLESNIASSLYLTIDNNPFSNTYDNVRLFSFRPNVIGAFKVNFKYPAFVRDGNNYGKYMISLGLHQSDTDSTTTKLVEKLKDFRFRGSGAAVPSAWTLHRCWFVPSTGTVMYKLKNTASGKSDVYSLSVLMYSIQLRDITDATGLTFNSTTYAIQGEGLSVIDNSQAFQTVKDGKSGLILFSDQNWADDEVLGFAHWLGWTRVTSVEDLDLTGGTSNEND